MNIPTDYEAGYENARAIAPDVAAKYIAHTHIGDPLDEAMAEDLAEFSSEESMRLVEAAMNNGDGEALRGAPDSLREFFRDAETPPEWLDYSAFAPGVRMFHRNSQLVLAAFVAGVLIEGFTTNIAKSFLITGRFRDQGVRRLGQNNRHICEPDSPTESVVMAHSLVDSAPLIAGVTEPDARRSLARYVYRISRGLIGKETAESLMYPLLSSFGVVGWFKLQQRYGHILSKLTPGRRQDSNFTRFTSLLDTSLFDEDGIRYSLPDHVYSEESSRW